MFLFLSIISVGSETRIVSLNAAKANNTIQGELVNVNQLDIISVSSYHKMGIENNIMELSLENQSNRQSRAIVSVGAMVLFLRGSASAWKACSTVARGIGMSGCGAIVVSDYSTVKYVYDSVR